MHLLPLEPLTPASFAPFGTVIANPSTYPFPARSEHSVPEGQSANQGTATKYSPIAPLVDAYRTSSRNQAGEARFSLFVCEPRSLTRSGTSRNVVTQSVLERHPFTTQAFVPLGVGPQDVGRTAFVVIVAPSSSSSFPSGGSPPSSADKPDIARARAFLATGDMAVNYGVGTWHAPMIVVGERAIEFVVVQFVNGVPQDDCVECYLEEKDVIRVDVSEALDASASRGRRTRSTKL